MRYEAILGPNTNQWWVYDNTEDVYIDPPIFILESVKRFAKLDQQKAELERFIAKEPSWLKDTDHWYKEIEP